MNLNNKAIPKTIKEKVEELKEAQAELGEIQEDIEKGQRAVDQEIVHLQRRCRHLNTKREFIGEESGRWRMVCKECGLENLPLHPHASATLRNNFRPPSAKYMGNQHNHNLHGK